ncbi:MAG: hypothetical protein Ct9H300mP1_15930 [Planctomycetaceae bacterium]|nr:MAG: hypothetical protein Ct9H300mP1_15930 [Planctomycetaceae bacterium]
MYSFDPKGDGKGAAKLLWRFDANPKEAKWILGGRGTRNNIIATPVVYDGLVYVAVGQDPEHGEGMGHLWAIDPTKRGDTSPTKAYDKDGKEIPFEKRRRLQNVIAKEKETIKPNPNHADIWHYGQMTEEKYNATDFEHRCIGRVEPFPSKRESALHRGLQWAVSLPGRQDGEASLDLRHVCRVVGVAVDC